MKKALLWCLLLVVVCVSCKQNVDEEPKPQHVHSYSVMEDGRLICQGCDKVVSDEYIAYVDASGRIEEYRPLYAGLDANLIISGMDISYELPAQAVRKDVILFTLQGQNISINAPDCSITHYGKASSVVVLDTGSGEYVESGTVEVLSTILKGNARFGRSVPSIIVGAMGDVSISLDANVEVESINANPSGGPSSSYVLSLSGDGRVGEIDAYIPLNLKLDVEHVCVGAKECSSIVVSSYSNVSLVEVLCDGFSSADRLHVVIEVGSSVGGILIQKDLLDLESPKHVHIWRPFDEAKDPTCTEYGWNRYSTCQSCGYSSYNEIHALGHDLEKHPAKDATCTDVGWYEYEICLRCGYTTYMEIPAKGHSFASDWSIDATSHWHASTCGHMDEVSDKGLHAWNEENVCSICGTRNEGSGGVVIDPCEYELSLVFPEEWDGSLVVVPNVSATLRAVLKPERNDVSYAFFVDGEFFDTQGRPELVLGAGEGEVALGSGLHVITVMVFVDETSYSEAYKLDVREGGCGTADSSEREAGV